VSVPVYYDNFQVTVVISTYNRGSLIKRTLDSVFAQTMPPDEVIVVDDVSTDGTGDWVKENYPTVKVIRNSVNLMTSESRNVGAREAGGNVLIFLDHDDELLPKGIEILLGGLAAFPEAKASFSDHTLNDKVRKKFQPNHYEFIADYKKRLSALRPSVVSGGYSLFKPKSFYRNLIRGNMLQQPYAVYKKVFTEIGGYRRSVYYCEDWDMYLRLIYRAQFVFTKKIVSNHIIERGSLSLNDAWHMWLKVLWHQFFTVDIIDVYSRVLLLRKISILYKTKGDQLLRSNFSRAYLYYLKAFLVWPFDPAVACRALFVFPLFWCKKNA